MEKMSKRDLNICRIALAAALVLTLAALTEITSAESEIVVEPTIKEPIKNEPKIEESVPNKEPIEPEPEPEEIEEPEEPIVTEPEEPQVVEETLTFNSGQPAFDYYDIPLDEDLQDHIFLECEFYDVDPALIISIIKKESEFRDWVIGDNGRSYGLMQIQERWHEERMDRLQVTDLLNPYQNITVGVDYFAELLDTEKGVEWALMAYNGGPSYANKLRAKNIVSNYVKTVLGYCETLGRK